MNNTGKLSAIAQAVEERREVGAAKFDKVLRNMKQMIDLNAQLDQICDQRNELIDQGMKTKQKNKASLAEFQQQNEVLKQRLKEFKLQSQDNKKYDQKTINTAEKDLALYRRKLDDLKNKTQKKRQQLSALQDKQKEVLMVSSDLTSSDHPQAKQIRVLGNRLDKVMIKYNEALSIKKTYDVIKQRLLSEKGVYETQLKKIEESMSQKQHDLQELIQMSQEAALQKKETEKELTQFEQSQIKQEQAKPPRRVQVNMFGKGRGADLDFDLQNEVNPDKEPMSAEVKQAMALIEEKTEIQTLSQVIDKMERYAETQSSLLDMQKSLQSKLIQLLDKRDNLKKQTSASLPVGGGQGLSKQQQFDEHERQINALLTKYERIKDTLEKEQKLKIEVNNGLYMLQDKLVFIDDLPGEDVAEPTMIDILKKIERKLKTMGERSSAAPSQGRTSSLRDQLARQSMQGPPKPNSRPGSSYGGFKPPSPSDFDNFGDNSDSDGSDDFGEMRKKALNNLKRKII